MDNQPKEMRSVRLLHTKRGGDIIELTFSVSHIRNILSQAKELVNRLQSDRKMDVDNDWKLITLFIGGNDLCAFCKDPVYKLTISDKSGLVNI